MLQSVDSVVREQEGLGRVAVMANEGGSYQLSFALPEKQMPSGEYKVSRPHCKIPISACVCRGGAASAVSVGAAHTACTGPLAPNEFKAIHTVEFSLFVEGICVMHGRCVAGPGSDVGERVQAEIYFEGDNSVAASISMFHRFPALPLHIPAHTHRPHPSCPQVLPLHGAPAH